MSKKLTMTMMRPADGLTPDPEREWTFEDCRVAKYSWGYRVWASGGHCDVVPGNGDDMDACEQALDRGESPIASGWEDGAGSDVGAVCDADAEDE